MLDVSSETSEANNGRRADRQNVIKNFRPIVNILIRENALLNVQQLHNLDLLAQVVRLKRKRLIEP